MAGLLEAKGNGPGPQSTVREHLDALVSWIVIIASTRGRRDARFLAAAPARIPVL
jgi:hypothetical protein